MEYESHSTCQSIYYYQGCIEPPEAARGHATSVVGSVDSEMYIVTKNSTHVSHKLLCEGRSDLSRVLLALQLASRLPEYEGNGAETLSSSTSACYLFDHSLYLVTFYISPSRSCMPSRHLRQLDTPLLLLQGECMQGIALWGRSLAQPVRATLYRRRTIHTDSFPIQLASVGLRPNYY